MNVVYVGTRNLYQAMMPSIRSLLDHNHVDRLYLVIEDDSFPVDIPGVDLRVINVSDQKYFGPDSANIGTRFSYMCMMRVTYADILDCDRVISLDCDTIINDSLEPIFQMDLDGKWFAAVKEPFKTELYDRNYYNGGVIVYNLEQMRKDGAVAQLVDLLNREQLAFIDQDALSRFTEKSAELPVRYNETMFTGLTDNPAVVHYAAIGDWFTTRRMDRIEFLDRYR